ncbi:Ribosomal RNA small subunit methyltransferase I [bacterium HR34]|nr:Ribosomal RNA small subunit methyltransferase I [bacterium HR34]
MTLFVVPTPIGNLKDITFRAVEVLKSVDYIICEDTRRTKILLNHYDIKDKKLISYFAPKEDLKIPKILELLKEKDAALVVDAGFPGVSDPGHKLINKCLEKDIKVEVLPGPSAFLTALIGSGLPTNKFLFLGFLPKKGLQNYLLKFKDIDATLIFYDSPQRLSKNLNVIKNVFGNAKVVVARELTKVFEEYIRGTIDEVLNIISEKKIRGEVTVILKI